MPQDSPKPGWVTLIAPHGATSLGDGRRAFPIYERAGLRLVDVPSELAYSFTHGSGCRLAPLRDPAPPHLAPAAPEKDSAAEPEPAPPLPSADHGRGIAELYREAAAAARGMTIVRRSAGMAVETESTEPVVGDPARFKPPGKVRARQQRIEDALRALAASGKLERRTLDKVAVHLVLAQLKIASEDAKGYSPATILRRRQILNV